MPYLLVCKGPQRYCKGIYSFSFFLLPAYAPTHVKPSPLHLKPLLPWNPCITLLDLTFWTPITYTALWTVSFPCYHTPFPLTSLWRMTQNQTWTLSFPITSFPYNISSALDPDIHMVDRYWLLPIARWTFPLSLTYCTMLWLTLTYATDWYLLISDNIADWSLLTMTHS